MNPWPWIASGAQLPDGGTASSETRNPGPLDPALFDPAPTSAAGNESSGLSVNNTLENLGQIADQIEDALERIASSSGEEARKARIELIQLVSYVVGYLDAHGAISSGFSVLQVNFNNKLRPEKVIRELVESIREMLSTETRSAAAIGRAAIAIGKRVNWALVGMAIKDAWDAI